MAAESAYEAARLRKLNRLALLISLRDDEITACTADRAYLQALVDGGETDARVLAGLQTCIDSIALLQAKKTALESEQATLNANDWASLSANEQKVATVDASQEIADIKQHAQNTLIQGVLDDGTLTDERRSRLMAYLR